MGDRIRLLQIIDTLHTGGAERMAVNIANALTKNEIENGLIVTHSTGILNSYLNPKTKYIVLNKKHFFDILAFFKLVRFIIKFRPTHIHAHSTSIVWATFIKFVFIETKLIWHDHFGLDPKKEPRLYMMYLFPFISAVIVVKEQLMEWLNNFKTSLPATYISNFSALDIKRETSETVVVLCLANARRQKDFGNLIKATKYLIGKNMQIQIRIVGALSDLEYLNKLKSMISEYQLDKYIVLVGPSSKVEEELAIAHLGVLSSQSEGLPVSLIEYGLASLPVVVTNVGQCAEVVDHGQAGLLVEPGNPQQLADAIEYLLTNQSFAQVLGQKLYQRVKKYYGEDAFMEQYLELITKYI